MLVTTLVHASGQWIKGEMPIITNKMDPQGLGSAITYYRRYSLAAMIGVAPDDDDDAELAQNRKGSQIKAPPIPIDIDAAFDKIVKTIDAAKITAYLAAASDHYKKDAEAIKAMAVSDPQRFMTNFSKWSTMQEVKAG
jgi:hypothetical protein